MTATTKYQDFLELFRIVLAGSLSAVVPLGNFFFNYIPTPPELRGLFAAFAITSAAFAVPLVYSLREFLWEWHTDILSMKSKLHDIDDQISELGTYNSTQMNALLNDYQNILNTMRRRYYRGGGIRIQLASLLLFLAAMAAYGFYLSLSAIYPLLLYCTASGVLSGAFAIITLVIFGRPYRRYVLS
jgi:hypothetical protein